MMNLWDLQQLQQLHVALHSVPCLLLFFTDHMVSPEEVAERYNVTIDWKNIGGSKGLTSQQVRLDAMLYFCVRHIQQTASPRRRPVITSLLHLLLCAGQGSAGQAWVSRDDQVFSFSMQPSKITVHSSYILWLAGQLCPAGQAALSCNQVACSWQ